MELLHSVLCDPFGIVFFFSNSFHIVVVALCSFLLSFFGSEFFESKRELGRLFGRSLFLGLRFLLGRPWLSSLALA